MRKYFVPVLAALAVSGLSAPASADLGEVTITVDHSDLDLTKESDVETLIERVETAAAKACSSQPSSIIVNLSAKSFCRKTLMESAIELIEAKRESAIAVHALPVNLAAVD